MRSPRAGRADFADEATVQVCAGIAPEQIDTGFGLTTLAERYAVLTGELPLRGAGSLHREADGEMHRTASDSCELATIPAVLRVVDSTGND